MLKMLRKYLHKINTIVQLYRVKKGKNTGVFGKITIINRSNLTLGKNCSLNHGVYINAFNRIKICDNVTLSAGVKVISTGIDVNSWANDKNRHISNEGVFINNHCWIGANAIILPGVKITGEYVVIGAGGVVTKDISEGHCVYAGCPAKKVRDILEKEE